MNQLVADVLPGLLLILPLGVALLELLGRARPDAAGSSFGTTRWGIRLYIVLALCCGIWPLLIPGHPGLAPLHIDWLPALGFELGWQLSPAWSLLLAVTALAWARPDPDAPRPRRVAAALTQFALGSTVTGADLLTSVASLGLLGLAGLLLLAEVGEGASASRRVARRFALEWTLGLAAGLTLLVSVGLATNVADHSSWTFGWVELLTYVFPDGVQTQSLLLLLLCIAPYCGLFPFGDGFSRLADTLGPRAAVQWAIAAPVAGAGLWLTGVRALAPRMGAQLAFPLILFFCASALLRVLVAHGRASHDSDEAPYGAPKGGAGRFVVLPFLLAPALLTTGTPWGIYAVWLAVIAHTSNQLLALETSTLGDYLRAGGPGSATFAAWMATWMAMTQAVATLRPHEGVLVAPILVLPLVLGWAAILVVEREARGGTMQSSGHWRAAALICALAGVFPGLILERVGAHEIMRGEDFALTRCSDLELVDLRRPRLRSELRVNCADPRAELLRAFEADEGSTNTSSAAAQEEGE